MLLDTYIYIYYYVVVLCTYCNNIFINCCNIPLYTAICYLHIQYWLQKLFKRNNHKTEYDTLLKHKTY